MSRSYLPPTADQEKATTSVGLSSTCDIYMPPRYAGGAEPRSFEDEGCDRIWAQLVASIGSSTIRDLEERGVKVLGLS